MRRHEGTRLRARGEHSRGPARPDLYELRRRGDQEPLLTGDDVIAIDCGSPLYTPEMTDCGLTTVETWKCARVVPMYQACVVGSTARRSSECPGRRQRPGTRPAGGTLRSTRPPVQNRVFRRAGLLVEMREVLERPTRSQR